MILFPKPLGRFFFLRGAFLCLRAALFCLGGGVLFFITFHGAFAAPLPEPSAEGFHQWKERILRKEALKDGLSEAFITRALGEMDFHPRLLETINKQPEHIWSVHNYLSFFVTEERLQQGRLMLHSHRDLFGRAYKQYGVSPYILAALMGMESHFGTQQGHVNLLDSLSTLAYGSRRGVFFKKELLAFLHIIDDGHADFSFEGSWAGAFGYFQFMPTTFRRFAVDGDGDGKIDIVHNLSDAVFSAAHFLYKEGWLRGKKWGRQVRLNPDFPFELASSTYKRSVAFWIQKGVRPLGGRPLPADHKIYGAVLLTGDAGDPAFLVYHNFQLLLHWNASGKYALAVGILSDCLGEARCFDITRIAHQQNLERKTILSVQASLKAKGYSITQLDGVLGRETQAAVRRFQKDRRLPADGYLSSKLVDLLLHARDNQEES